MQLLDEGDTGGADSKPKGKARRKPHSPKEREPKKAKAPVKPISGYKHFQKETRKKLMIGDSSLKALEANRQAAELWKQLEVEQQLPYEQAATEDKERYAREMAAFPSPDAPSSLQPDGPDGPLKTDAGVKTEAAGGDAEPSNAAAEEENHIVQPSVVAPVAVGETVI